MWTQYIWSNYVCTITSAEDCEWEYGEFGDCSVTCGGGTKYRYPIIIRPATNGGRDCPQFVHDNEPDDMACNTNPCPGKTHI